MIKIGGELGIKVNKAILSNDVIQPHKSVNMNTLIDLSLLDTNGEYFHICGENDWGYLLVDALLPLLKYSDKIFQEINNMIEKYRVRPEVIGLGKNEYRAVDIMHRIRGLGDPINMYKGIPVVCLGETNAVKLFGKSEREYLPFE